MRIFSLLLALNTTVSTAFAVNTPAGEIDVSTGRIIVNGKKLTVVPEYAGYKGKPLALKDETYIPTSGKNPGYFISLYPDDSSKNQLSLTQHILITDATGKEIRQSNILDTGINFEWGDNNYVFFEGNTMHFGIYNRRCEDNNCISMNTPRRMQFIYHDGVLEEDKGSWRGPAKPRKYIEPTGSDPCGNVNGVEACREEVAREQEKKALQRRKKTKPTAMP